MIGYSINQFYKDIKWISYSVEVYADEVKSEYLRWDPDIIIAIDGHSGCGKSTTSKMVAKHFNYKYLDSGAMYRAVTLYFSRMNIKPEEIDKIKDELENILIEFKYVDGNQFTFLNNDWYSFLYIFWF